MTEVVGFLVEYAETSEMKRRSINWLSRRVEFGVSGCYHPGESNLVSINAVER